LALTPIFSAAAQADSVVKAFKSLGSLTHDLKGDDIIEKCQRMCEEHDLSAIDLAYKWEAHVDKVSPFFQPESHQCVMCVCMSYALAVVLMFYIVCSRVCKLILLWGF